jgi:hypothetical protein
MSEDDNLCLLLLGPFQGLPCPVLAQDPDPDTILVLQSDQQNTEPSGETRQPWARDDVISGP